MRRTSQSFTVQGHWQHFVWFWQFEEINWFLVTNALSQVKRMLNHTCISLQQDTWWYLVVLGVCCRHGLSSGWNFTRNEPRRQKTPRAHGAGDGNGASGGCIGMFWAWRKAAHGPQHFQHFHHFQHFGKAPQNLCKKSSAVAAFVALRWSQPCWPVRMVEWRPVRVCWWLGQRIHRIRKFTTDENQNRRITRSTTAQQSPQQEHLIRHFGIRELHITMPHTKPVRSGDGLVMSHDWRQVMSSLCQLSPLPHYCPSFLLCLCSLSWRLYRTSPHSICHIGQIYLKMSVEMHVSTNVSQYIEEYMSTMLVQEYT